MIERAALFNWPRQLYKAISDENAEAGVSAPFIVMPLTKKGNKIMSAMKSQYGAKKGKEVFYASQNKGTIKGTHKTSKK